MASSSKDPALSPELADKRESRKSTFKNLTFKSLELIPGLKKPVSKEELARRYKNALPGSAEKEDLGKELVSLQTIEDSMQENLFEARRRECQDHTNEVFYKAYEKALNVSSETPLHPKTATKVSSEKIEDICKESAAAAFKGYKVLKKLGATPQLLQKLSGVPLLLSAAANRKDAKEIIAMDDEELQDWIDDCGTHHADYLLPEDNSGDSDTENESDALESDTSADTLGSEDEDDEMEGLEEEEVELAAEVALDWSGAALQKTAEEVLGKVPPRNPTKIAAWSVTEQRIVVEQLRARVGEPWWKLPLKGTGIYKAVQEALRGSGFERSHNQITNKVRSLIDKKLRDT